MNAEIIFLGDYDPESSSRTFDAIRDGEYFFRGSLEHGVSGRKPTVIVASDRDDPASHECMITHGDPAIVQKEALARVIISQAVDRFSVWGVRTAIQNADGTWTILNHK